MQKLLHRLTKPLIGLLGLLMLSGGAQADATLTADLLRTFARCDSSFFTQLANTPDLASLGPLDTQPGFANFKVANPKALEDKSNQLAFSRPIQINGLTIQSYYDHYNNLGWDGRYWTWGFVLKGSQQDILKALPAEIRAMLHRDKGGDWVRAERIKLDDTPRAWQPINDEASGTVPAHGTAERVLSLGPISDNSSDVALLCSLQGFPDQALLQAIRPDGAKWLFDPAYQEKKKQLVSEFLDTYEPFSSEVFNKSEQALRDEAHAFIEKQKAAYAAAHVERPAAFWTEYEAAELQLSREMSPPTRASALVKILIGAYMMHYGDLEDLQAVVQAEEPRWTRLIMNGIVSQDAYFGTKSSGYVAVYERRQDELMKPLAERYGKMLAP
ncbi:hypothetical protein [Paludibacterium sp. B53371]|uniref:hypothetical protein n=1 Tax=Paludibacterium sp. B53371 TaxID=2806263 RepID=UPI001C041861|nr:hypothetical protein [Paludibacterium sp. B53371]